MEVSGRWAESLGERVVEGQMRHPHHPFGGNGLQKGWKKRGREKSPLIFSSSFFHQKIFFEKRRGAPPTSPPPRSKGLEGNVLVRPCASVKSSRVITRD